MYYMKMLVLENSHFLVIPRGFGQMFGITQKEKKKLNKQGYCGEQTCDAAVDVLSI